MMTHSLFDPEEIERESDVVVEEIKRSEDEPGDHVHELHLGHRWGDHPLGKPIIGTRESVKSFKRENIVSYMDRRYRGENILLSVSGNVDPQAIRALAEETLGSIPSGVSDFQPPRPEGSAKVVLESKDTEQVHFCIGSDGVSIYDEDDFFTLGVLDSALGGSMSSRIFQEVREKRGLVYSVGSYTLSYGAGGAFTVYGGTSMEKWPTVQEVIRSEFDRVMAAGLDPDELERTKTSLCAHLILALEGMSSRMMRMSKSELHHGRHIPIEETRDRIRAVTNERIIEMARRLLDPSKVSTTAIGPF
jgi:predicted Zn-dependent peptidase